MRYPVAAALALPVALAQTFTDCNPLQKTCPAEVGLPSSSYVADFTKGESAAASWTLADGTSLTYGNDGAVFEIASAGQAPTIATDFFILGGRVDVTMRAAAGTGIVSSIVLESADLDEIDWEFIGGDNDQVQSNFFGKGNTTVYDRVVFHPVSDPQNTWHTYSVDWTKEKMDFLIDGTVVRSLPYSSPLALGGRTYPQTPMQLKLGNWAGGASKDEGTVNWAGGKTDYSQAPFTMYVRKVEITNYNPACSYEFGDMTGSWDSIKIIKTGDNCSAGSGNAASTGASHSSTAATSSTGASSTSIAETATSAPTASQSVVGLDEQTRSGPSITVTGSAYSINSLSISALSSGFTTAPSAGMTAGGSNITVTGSGSGTGPTPISSPIQSSTGGASFNSVMVGGSVLSILATALML